MLESSNPWTKDENKNIAYSSWVEFSKPSLYEEIENFLCLFQQNLSSTGVLQQNCSYNVRAIASEKRPEG